MATPTSAPEAGNMSAAANGPIAGSATGKPSLFGDHPLKTLLESVLGQSRAASALQTLHIDPALAAPGDRLTRAQIAWALNAALFTDLLDRVPSAARYVAQARAAGQAIVSDHGALRTIDGPCGALPSGCEGMTRLLAPLGYDMAGLYPLPALKMTGRAFVQRDMPEAVPQFFISELHIDQLPRSAQDAAEAIFGKSADPISAEAWRALDVLGAEGTCTVDLAITILNAVLGAFTRQHSAPALADYEALLEHSKEGAWIATEGNAFNHATTRVPDVEALAERLRGEGFPMKPSVEVSASGRVRQTAFLADKVSRPFL